MIGGVEAGAELNAEADGYALGPESNERTSAAIVLLKFKVYIYGWPLLLNRSSSIRIQRCGSGSADFKLDLIGQRGGSFPFQGISTVWGAATHCQIFNSAVFSHHQKPDHKMVDRLNSSYLLRHNGRLPI